MHLVASVHLDVPVFSLVSGKVIQGQGHEGQGQGHKGHTLRSKCNISIFNILSKVKVARVKVKGRKSQGQRS